MGYLKGKSSLMIFDRHANLKYKYGIRKFWCQGYYVDTVGKNAKKIEEYIRNQLADDHAYDQMSIKEFVDPFTGEPVSKGNRNKGPCKGLGQRKWCGWRPFIQWPFQGLAGNTRLIGAEQTTR